MALDLLSKVLLTCTFSPICNLRSAAIFYSYSFIYSFSYSFSTPVCWDGTDIEGGRRWLLAAVVSRVLFLGSLSSSIDKDESRR